jgi:hypothetical protein
MSRQLQQGPGGGLYPVAWVFASRESKANKSHGKIAPSYAEAPGRSGRAIHGIRPTTFASGVSALTRLA